MLQIHAFRTNLSKYSAADNKREGGILLHQLDDGGTVTIAAMRKELDVPAECPDVEVVAMFKRNKLYVRAISTRAQHPVVSFWPKYRLGHPCFHYLKNHFLDKRIQNTFYLILKTEALFTSRNESAPTKKRAAHENECRRNQQAKNAREI